MSPLILDEAESIRAERGEIVLVIPVFGAHDRFVECVRSVLSHTPAEVPLLVIDDASPDERSRQLLIELDRADALPNLVHYLRHGQNRGFVASANEAFARCDPADVLVLNSDCVVTSGWIEAIKSAAEGSLVATVSVFTNNGTILSLPDRNLPAPDLPQTLALDRAARAIQCDSRRLHPRLPTAVGHCFLVKRSALELVGPFDEAFSPGYGEEVDFSQRCIKRGLLHVLADDAFVLHRGSASFGSNSGSNRVKELHDRKIGVRYPYYDSWVSRFSTSNSGPFSHAIDTASRALRKLTVTIDARSLGPVMTGTQVHTLELITAIARDGDLRVRAVVSPDLGRYAQSVLSGLSDVQIVPLGAIAGGAARTDVVHRPSQISSREELGLLDAMGGRIVVTQQDLIGYHNPTYFRTYEEWDEYRRIARHALGYADRVVFFSHSAANDAMAEDLVDSTKVDVVYIGTDHALDALPAHERPPGGIDLVAGRPYLLCLGTDFAHKNRVFALQILESLQREHGYRGALVFAGPHVRVGSSAADEAEFLAMHPSLRNSVVDVAAVDEGEKRWLLRNAAVMIYPTVHEGFGLVPFESAEFALLCAFAPQTSLAELLPSKLALIVPWNAGETAHRLAPYIAPGELRAKHIAAVRAAGARFTWQTTAARLADVYRSAVHQPIARSRTLIQETQADDRIRFQELEQHYGELRSQYDWAAERLLGPDGLIPRKLRRPLLAIGRRPMLRDVTFGLIRAMYVAGYWLKHARRPPRD